MGFKDFVNTQVDKVTSAWEKSFSESAGGNNTFLFNNTSFSGCDVKLIINIPPDVRLESMESDLSESDGGAVYPSDVDQSAFYSGAGPTPQPVVVGEATTLSVSTHRDKTPVRSFSQVNMKNEVRGHRTIAGSLISVAFNHATLQKLVDEGIMQSNPFTAYEVGGSSSQFLSDQLPPFDMLVLLANEYGQVARMGIYGVSIQTEGLVISQADLYTECTMTYIARHIDPLRPILDPSHGGQDSITSTMRQALNDLSETIALGKNAAEIQQATRRLSNIYTQAFIKEFAKQGTTVNQNTLRNILYDNTALEILAASRNMFR